MAALPTYEDGHKGQQALIAENKGGEPVESLSVTEAQALAHKIIAARQPASAKATPKPLTP